MSRFFFICVLVLSVTDCFSQEYPRPTFPDVFQVDVEGTFVQESAVIEIDASVFYDRINNRAALFMTKGNDLTRQIYSFDTNEILTINDYECEVNQISEERYFFPFTVVDGKKVLGPAEEAFYFTEVDTESQPIAEGIKIPTLVYKVTGKKIPLYGKTNCNITHTFSIPDVERPTCKEGIFCNSSLVTVLVECENEDGVLDTYNSYRFSRMKPEIEDDLVFLPPPGVYCDVSSGGKTIPPFPTYFSFGFDVREKPKGSEEEKDTTVFNKHGEIWYDAKYEIVRIDEYHYKGLLISSKIFDIRSEMEFTKMATVPACGVGLIRENLQLDTITRLPKAFFVGNESAAQNAVYVGKRNVHGLNFEVWSLKWTSEETEENVVEELYFLQILPANNLPGTNVTEDIFYQLSHIDMYIYSTNEDTGEAQLSLLKHFSINNFQSDPKEWDAFDVSNCFDNDHKKQFSIKVEATPIAEGGRDYKKVLELLYDQIVAATGISIVRIGKLTGVFDGVNLLEIKGAIIDNSNSSEWSKKNNEPGMEEVFTKIEEAVRNGKLSIIFEGSDNKIKKIKIISVEFPKFGEYPRPTFPDVFQVDVEGTFVTESAVVEIDASVFYDRTNNRAALFLTRESALTTQIYNFNTDEILTIEGHECKVNQIPDERGFFPFTVVNGKKVLDPAEKAFFFTEEEQRQILIGEVIPQLVYKVTGQKVELYDKSNCDITHTFSTPDVEVPTCKDTLFCNSTLTTILVQCKDDEGVQDVYNSYRFSRMKPRIEDESVFFPSPGTHCGMSNGRTVPPFPSYFSFGFDIAERYKSSEYSPVFNTHKEVWYDAGYGIVRIDEFHYNGLLLSSKIFDLKDKVAFTKIATVPECDMGPIEENFLPLDTVTRLPKSFFEQKESAVQNAVYVGKRNVHGLDYDVWSLNWTSEATDENVVEELYFLQILPVNSLPGTNDTESTYYQLSHVDMYIYSTSEDIDEEEVILLKHFSINNFKSDPKEWDAFDVSNCFDNDHKKEFSIKIEATPIAKGGRDYKKVLELLYEQIVAATGISIVRIGKLTGVFDGVDLQEFKGAIIDNSNSSGWSKENNEPGMEEIFTKIEEAAIEDKLSVTFEGADKTIRKIKVISVEVPKYGEYPRPTFPDVFQVDVEGTVVTENAVAEIDATVFYDRTNNRAALFLTRENDLTRQIYNFDTDEILTISGNECEVNQISDERGFFPITVVNGKKVLDPAEKAFYFSKEAQRQILIGEVIPKLVYKVTGQTVELFDRTDCDITHTFSTPDVEIPTCKDTLFCNSTLTSILIQCKNDEGVQDVYNSYRFSRMKPEIEDDSVFLPYPGIHCNMSNRQAIPPFPSYFSFGFDITEKSKGSKDTAVFSTHKEIWFDAGYGIARIDEYHYNGLLLSSKIFDLKDEIAFTRIATVPTCDMGPIQEHLELDTITRLPKAFFAQNQSAVENAIYVGKRNVHGLDYEVWSLEWNSGTTEENVVEELYFLQILPIDDLLGMNVTENTLYQLSHIDLYIYSENEDTNENELSLLKHFAINNFKSNPKEWGAFDVGDCFNHEQKKEFSFRIEATPIAKGSKDYKKVLELLYDQVVAAAGVSIVRIAKLTGVFDGVDLLEIKGSIIDNSKSSGWPKENEELGMEEAFSKIEEAARDDKLSITFKGDDNMVKKIKVLSVEIPRVPTTNSCYSGAYVAVASLVLLIVGILFGIGGYYVFLKKRKTKTNLTIRMNDLKPKILLEEENEDGLS